MASAQEIRRRMEEIQATREAAFEPLMEILEQRQELQRELAALDEPYGHAYAAAEAAGWTAQELTAIGAEEPARRPKGRPRKRAAAKRAAPEATSPVSVATSSATTVPAQDGAEEAAAATAASMSG